jgi:hypothetical protein
LGYLESHIKSHWITLGYIGIPFLILRLILNYFVSHCNSDIETHSQLFFFIFFYWQKPKNLIYYYQTYFIKVSQPKNFPKKFYHIFLNLSRKFAKLSKNILNHSPSTTYKNLPKIPNFFYFFLDKFLKMCYNRFIVGRGVDRVFWL